MLTTPGDGTINPPLSLSIRNAQLDENTSVGLTSSSLHPEHFTLGGNRLTTNPQYVKKRFQYTLKTAVGMYMHLQ